MSELPRPVLDAIRAHLGDDHLYALDVLRLLNAKGLVQALLDAKVLVLMDDHMEVVRDRNEWEDADEEACEALSRERAETAWLREALEEIAAWRPDGAIPNWKIVLDGDAARAMQAHARAALNETEPAT